MSKAKTVIESITKLESKETGMTIEVFREEENKDFDHDLNKKVFADIMRKEHKTLYDMAEALLHVHRVNAVEVRTKGGNGIHLYKDFSNE